MSTKMDPVDTLTGKLMAAEATVAELARHNQELSLALSAAERRVKEAEATQQSLLAVSEQYVLEIRELETKLDHALDLMNSQTTGSYFVLAEVDQLKTENKILQRTAELQLALVSATADVVEAARDLLNHECQICREHWDDAREAIAMRLAIALDRLDGRSPIVHALDQASPPLASGRPRTGYSGTYEDLGDVELPPEERAEAERQQAAAEATVGPVSQRSAPRMPVASSQAEQATPEADSEACP